MAECGIFNDEGCVGNDFYSENEAIQALKHYSVEDGLYVALCCEEHREHAKDACEFCT